MSTPVRGSATADTSATERSPPQPVAEKFATALCHAGAPKIWLQPLPPSSQAVLLQVPCSSDRVVPPTATTPGADAGKFALAGLPAHAPFRYPQSPELAVSTTPG